MFYILYTSVATNIPNRTIDKLLYPMIQTDYYKYIIIILGNYCHFMCCQIWFNKINNLSKQNEK